MLATERGEDDYGQLNEESPTDCVDQMAHHMTSFVRYFTTVPSLHLSRLMLTVSQPILHRIYILQLL